jgi:hypothetical protein
MTEPSADAPLVTSMFVQEDAGEKTAVDIIATRTDAHKRTVFNGEVAVGREADRGEAFPISFFLSLTRLAQLG